MSKGMEMMLKQFGITPEKIQEMAEPVVTAILNKVAEFDANQERRHTDLVGLIAQNTNMLLARFDILEQMLREETGATQPAGVGGATSEIDPETLAAVEASHEMEDTITLES